MRSQKSSLIVLLFSAYLLAQPAVISESEGWLESVFIKWTPVAGAQRYNVYYSGEGVTDRKIDDQLIRGYGSYFRADIPGLKAGTYTIKVVPVISGVEGEAVVSGPLTVKAHERSGFAFWNGQSGFLMTEHLKDGGVIYHRR